MKKKFLLYFNLFLIFYFCSKNIIYKLYNLNLFLHIILIRKNIYKYIQNIYLSPKIAVILAFFFDITLLIYY